MRSQCLSLLTLNLWHDNPPAERRSVQRENIEALAPDIIAFQEVLRGPDSCQATSLLEGLGYDVVFGDVVPFWKDTRLRYGNAVASRWPFRSEHNHELPTGGEAERRAVVCTEIESPFGSCFVACSHFHHREPAIRALQAADAIAAFSRFRRERGAGPATPHFFLGDLNASPGHELTPLFAPHFDDAFERVGAGPGLTWSKENPYAIVSEPPGVRIDYVFAGRGTNIRFRRCEVVCNRPRGGVFASDHFGVYAEIELPAA